MKYKLPALDNFFASPGYVIRDQRSIVDARLANRHRWVMVNPIVRMLGQELWRYFAT